ncbi:MAG: internal scaffolding protein [Microviridae sp.]|nr:MAG: internal scaffolding protein [Microviridae sp.]
MSKFVVPKIRTASNIDRAAWAASHGLKCEDPSRAVQSQKDESDINNIVRLFGVTGKLPDNVRVPSYGDFDGISDYREAIEAVRSAEASFLAMPSELRERLDHNPQRFLEYCEDPSNLEEMRKLGLAIPAPVEGAS